MKDGTIIHYDPLTGEVQKFFYEEETDTVTIKYCWKPETTTQVLEMNKKLQNAGGDWFKSKTPGESDFWHAAQIPHSIQMKWLIEEQLDIRKKEHWPRLKKKLNDPEWRYLRTGEFSL